MLKYLDAYETETAVYIVTERVQPLSKSLEGESDRAAAATEEWLIWGLHRISVRQLLCQESSETHS